VSSCGTPKGEFLRRALAARGIALTPEEASQLASDLLRLFDLDLLGLPPSRAGEAGPSVAVRSEPR
jgi:hypothetical protein